MRLGVELGAADDLEAWLGEMEEETPHLPKPF